MSVLLRHPATVPTLFSRAVDPDPVAMRDPWPWSRATRGQPIGDRASRGLPLILASVLLVEVPLVQAAAAAVRLALPHLGST